MCDLCALLFGCYKARFGFVGDGACISMMYWKARREETIQCQPKILSMMGNRTNVPGMPDISRNEAKLKIMGI